MKDTCVHAYIFLRIQRDDANKNTVTISHRRKIHITRPDEPAVLEVFDAGLHMLDVIVVTFIFLEKKQGR